MIHVTACQAMQCDAMHSNAEKGSQGILTGFAAVAVSAWRLIVKLADILSCWPPVAAQAS